MRLAQQLLLTAIIAFLISACAQVGRLSGGDEDDTSPQPVKTIPENESTNFSGNSFTITFDEYVRLNKPSESIVMVPPHVKPTATINKKTVNISWEGELKPNTTYALYLNKAVKDITEGNDSVMQFVFSTGDKIDTLSYTCVLHDAYTGKPLADHLIGAYRVSDTSLLNIAQTDELGIAKMNYLSAGDYRFFAFNDLNNDMIPQLNESIGFKDDITTIGGTVVDSIPYRVFEPLKNPGVRKKAVISSSKIAVGFHHLIDSSTLRIIDTETSSELSFRFVAPDSILIFPEDTVDWRSKKLALEDDQFVDTLSLLNRSGRSRFQLNIADDKILPGEAITLEGNQIITAVDDTMFRLFLNEDTSIVDIEKIEYKEDRVFIYLVQGFEGEATLEFLPGAVTCANGVNRKRTMSLELLTESDLTVLDADISSYSVPLIITCFNEGEEVRSVRTNGEPRVLLKGLVPGNYTFRIVLDENNNGLWDSGNFITRLQPEGVHYYSEPIRLRPNWESTITFTLDE